jgi:lipoprotein-releasing system permease protein
MKEGQSKLPNIRKSLDFNSGFQEFDATYVLGDIRHMQRINKWKADQVGAFEVFVDDFDNIKTVGEDVYQHTGSMLDNDHRKIQLYI